MRAAERTALGLLSLGLVVMLLGCPPPVVSTDAPTAQFSADPLVGPAPLRVYFMDESLPGGAPITFRRWDFGDGDTGVAQNSVHTYSKPGRYTVTLVVGSPYGVGREVKEELIVVQPLLEPDFTAEPVSGYQPLQVQFTDSSKIAEDSNPRWRWNFGDGAISTQQHPVHTYVNPGKYSVSLTITTDDDQKRLFKPELIEVKPSSGAVPDFSASQTRGPRPLPVVFRDRSVPGTSPIITWNWDFGDGNISEEQSPGHIYTQSGLFTVTLTIMTQAGEELTKTRENYIEVTAPPVASFTAEPVTGYAPLEVEFLDTSDLGRGANVSWFWDFGDGATSTQQHPTHTYTKSGIYTVSLRVTTEFGVNTMSRNKLIDVTPARLPVASFTAAPLSGPSPLKVTFTDTSRPGSSAITEWLWDFGDGGTSTEQHPTHTYTRLGRFTVALTVKTAQGEATETKTDAISVSSSSVTFGGTKADRATDMLVLEDGSYVVAGVTRSFGAGEQDMCLLKVDPHGNQVWLRTYGSPRDDFASALIQLPDGGFALAGDTLTERGDRNVRLIRTDASGNEIWSQSYGGATDETVQALALTASGGFLLAGGFVTETGVQNMLIIITDALGRLLSQEVYGGAGFDLIHAAITFDDGSTVLAGETSSEGAGGRDMYLFKLGPDGAPQWSRNFGGAQNEVANALAVTEDGGFLLAGSTNSAGAGGLDMLLVRTDAEGRYLWSRTYGGLRRDTANDVIVTSDGGYLLAGVTESFGAGASDMYLVKTDADGEPEWMTVSPLHAAIPGIALGGAQAEEAAAVVEAPNGAFVAAGYTESAGAGSLDIHLRRVSAGGAPVVFPLD